MVFRTVVVGQRVEEVILSVVTMIFLLGDEKSMQMKGFFEVPVVPVVNSVSLSFPQVY